MSEMTRSQIRRLQDKVCVVTGAAGGVGIAVAQRLAAEGAHVVGVDLLPHDTGEVSIQSDLTNEVLTKQLYAAVREEFGHVDVLVNNAGLNDRADGHIFKVTTETWERVLAANLTTTFLCCKYGIPHLLDNDPPGGSVINTATFLAQMGAATAQMAYSAAKAGVVALSRDLGIHLARRGVRVNSLSLGPVDTPLLQELFAKEPELARQRLIHMPMGRYGTVEEVAGAVAFLASNDSGFITASTFPLDGGITNAYTVPS